MARTAISVMLACFVLTVCITTNAKGDCAKIGNPLFDFYCRAPVFPTNGQRFVQDLDLTYPDGAPRITSDYAANERVRTYGPHPGIDWEGPYGRDVIAAADGYARQIYSTAGGTAVRIRHVVKYVRTVDGEDGPISYAFVIRTAYAHLSRTDITIGGKRVKRGEKIGEVGQSGSYAGNEPHLHFGSVVGKYIDGHMNPHMLWADGPGVLTCFDATREYPRDSLVLTLPLRCRE